MLSFQADSSDWTDGAGRKFAPQPVKLLDFSEDFASLLGGRSEDAWPSREPGEDCRKTTLWQVVGERLVIGYDSRRGWSCFPTPSLRSLGGTNRGQEKKECIGRAQVSLEFGAQSGKKGPCQKVGQKEKAD